MEARRTGFTVPTPLLLLMLAVGLTWLGFSIHQGLTNGHESDSHRRWKTFQYALAGVNPYPLSAAALEKKYGGFEEFRRTGKELFAIPRLAPKEVADPAARAMVERYGTPEATYPPSAELLMGLLVGWVPESALHLVGILTNVLLLAAIAWLLTSGTAAGNRASFVVALALFLLWSPAQSTVVAGQSGLIVLASALLGVRIMAERPVLAGVLFAVALTKPTLGLPFLLMPLIRRGWTTLAVAGGIHVVLLVVQSARFGVAPWDLLAQWLEVGRYFTHCMYTLQELLNRTGLDHTAAGWAITLAFVAAVAGWCWICRDADDDKIVDFLCLAALLWTYHAPYDFVLLFVPLLRVIATTQGKQQVVVIGCFVALSLGTSVWVYGNDTFAPWWMLRLLTRGLLMAYLIALAMRLRERRDSAVDLPFDLGPYRFLAQRLYLPGTANRAAA